MFILGKYRPVFAPEGGAGGGEGADDTTWSPPDGIPAEFVGSTADETLSKMLPAYTDLSGRAEGLRTKLAQMPSAPETADAYTFEAEDKLKPWFSDLDNSPAWGHAKTAAHAAGLSQDQLQNFVSGVYGPMVDAGMINLPYDAASEIKSFSEAGGLDQKGTEQALINTEAFAKGLSGQLKGIPESMKAEVDAHLIALTDSAGGNFLLQALASRLSENGIRISGDGGSQGELTAEDLKALHSDPRIDPRNRNHKDPDKRYDEDLRKRYDEACSQAR